MTGNPESVSWTNVVHPREREFEAIRQRMKAMPPCMVVMQHDEDILKDEAIKR